MRVRQGLTIPFLVLFVTTCAVTALADLDAVSPGPPLTNSKRFLVHLKVTTSPEGSLPNSDAVARQRRALDKAKAAIRTALTGRPHRVTREYHALPFLAIEGGSEVLAVLAPMVTTVYPDHLFRVSLPESVPLVRATQAWAQGFDGSGSVVAVLDTGVDKLHPFLAGKVSSEACYSGNGNCPNGADTQQGAGAGVSCTFAPGACPHGTHVAGIAAGSGATFSGVAKGSQIMAIQVYSKFTGTVCAGGENPCALAYTSDLIAAMEHVYELRSLYRIAAVNMSLGGDVYTSTSQCDADNAPTKAIIDTLRSVGIATVIAAGNNGASTGITAPGCISSAISVGSTTKSDTISSFSNSASFLSVLAPGSSILSSVPGGGFAVLSGTSMATPHVAGAWAIVKQKSPQASVAAVLDALVTTGVLLTDPRNGITKRRIDVAGAVALVAGQSAASLTVNGSSAGITVSSGATVTVGWSGMTWTPNDCLLQYHPAQPSHYGNAIYVTSGNGSQSYVLPSSADSWSWRYYGNGCNDLFATSPTVTAQVSTGQVTVNGSSGPITVVPGATVTVGWSGMTWTPNDCLLQYHPAQPSHYGNAIYVTSGNGSQSYVLPSSADSWSWRYYGNGCNDLFATSPTVTAQVSTGQVTVNGSSGPITVVPGATVTVGWSGMTWTPNDCLLQYHPAQPSHYGNAIYVTSGSGSQSYVLPSSADSWSWRYYGNGCNDLFTTSPLVTVQ